MRFRKNRWAKGPVSEKWNCLPKTRQELGKRNWPRQNQWRKCMGIEPTNHMISMRLNGFEDRGQHQLSKHFRIEKA
jgi:hypothetical protein